MSSKLKIQMNRLNLKLIFSSDFCVIKRLVVHISKYLKRFIELYQANKKTKQLYRIQN